MREHQPEAQFYQEVRVWNAKFDAEERQANGDPIPEEIARLLANLIATSTTTGDILDIFTAAGMPKPSLSDLGPSFAASAAAAENPQLARCPDVRPVPAAHERDPPHSLRWAGCGTVTGVRIPGLNKQSVRGKVVLVTGASRGIGAAIATELANRGARVALLGRDESALATVTASLSKLSGDHAYFIADVTSDESVEKATAAAAAYFGGIDVVVANAGIVSYGTVFVCESTDFARVMDTNVTGTYRTVRSALPHLQASRGYILIMGSISSFSSLGGLASYTASKAGAEALAHALYMELDHTGIGVGMIYPSWVDTEMIANAEQAMPSFKRVRRQWAAPAQIPGLSKWPGGTATPEQCAHVAVNTIERRGRRSWVPLPLWALSFVRVALNSLPGERIQIRLFDHAIRQFDGDLTQNGEITQPR